MEKTAFLPLGSIVIIKGGVKKAVIVARGLAAAFGGEPVYFDYGGCLYPEGIIGDALLYFNHEDIFKVVFTGYADEDDELMKENIFHWLDKSALKKGNPYEINRPTTPGEQTAPEGENKS
jgi:hypothetical protein